MISIVIHVSGDLHQHVADQERLDEILTALADLSIQLATLGETIMAAAEQQFRELLARINTATNNIAADIQKLLDQIEGGLSAEAAAALIAEYTPVVTQLEAVASEVPEAPPA